MGGQISRLVAQPGASNGRLSAHAERDWPVRVGRRPRAGGGPDSLFGHRAAVVRQRDQGSLSGDSGRRADRVRNAHLPAAGAGRPPGWKFPDGTVLVETLSLEMEQGNPASRRRLETRILHHERLTGDEDIGDQSWQGYTYVWNDEQTDAVLLEDPKGLRPHLHDRRCRRARRQAPTDLAFSQPHRMRRLPQHGGQVRAGRANAADESRITITAAAVANQLRTLEHLGLFTEPLPEAPEELPRLADYRAEQRGPRHAGPARICTPIVRTAIASGAAATPTSNCWPRSTWPRWARSASARDRGPLASRTREFSRRAIRIGLFCSIAWH